MLEPLIGRDDLLGEIQDALGSNRLVTLTGSGGAGKSTVAREIVERARATRESFFLDLTSLGDGKDFALALAARLELPDEGDPGRLVAHWASSRNALLALDNLEQASGVGDPIVRLLESAPAIQVLATSRIPLGAPGEYEIRVPGLELPMSDDPLDVEGSPAAGLLLQRARAVGALRGELAPGDAAEIAALCRALDGLPLAVELAAARTRLMSPRAILRRLKALDTGVLRRDDGDSRHRSLEAVLSWSLGLLSDGERDTLESCASCFGSFDLDLIKRLASEDPLLPIERLVMHGLVTPDEEVAGEPRFRLLESVRLTVLATSADRIGAFARDHANAMAAIAMELDAGIDGGSPRAALVRFDADRQNFEAAIDWAMTNDRALACRLLWATGTYWSIRGAVDEPARRVRELLQGASLDRESRALALGAVVRLLRQADNDDESRKAAGELAPLARDLNLRTIELEALTQLAVSGAVSGRRPDRHAVLQRVVEMTPRTDREAALVGFGQYLLASDRGEGRDFLMATIAELRGAGRLRQLGLWLANLGSENLGVRDPAGALAAVEEGIEVAADLGQPDLTVYCLGVKAIALAQLRDLDAAAAAISHAVRVAAALVTLPMFWAIMDRGTIATVLGNSLDAAWFLGAAEALYDPTPVEVFEEGNMFAPEWKAAKRAIDSVTWELARRAGRTASQEEVLERALAPLTTARDDSLPAPARLRHGVLTTREIEILTLVADGLTDGAIAERLFISPKTASVHVANAKAKLGADSRLDLALRARELLGASVSRGSQAVHTP